MTKTTTGDRLHEVPLLKQGTVVSGRFTIKRFIAEGGMGRVYVAEQQPMGRKVALKVMRRDLIADDRAVKRFFQEAVAISKLNHPNTITLFDYGEGEGGSLFIAMEYLDGLTLKEIVTHHKRLSVEKTARIIAQIGLSLAEGKTLTRRQISQRHPSEFQGSRWRRVRWLRGARRRAVPRP